MFFEYFQVIQLIPCEPIRLTGIKYPNNNCLKNCLIILLRTLVRAPPPLGFFLIASTHFHIEFSSMYFIVR